MNKQPTGLFLLFSLLGIISGLAIAVLIQPDIPKTAAAGVDKSPGIQAGLASNGQAARVADTLSQGSQPTPNASGAILSGEPVEGSSADPGLPTNLAPVPIYAPAAQMANRAYTYQGVLRRGGQPLTEVCDFQFGMWDALTAGVQLGVTQTITSTLINGQFTTLLNNNNQFPASAFDGRAAWIATSVRCPTGSGSYTPLKPRQALRASPLAAGLTPHATLNSEETYSGYPAMSLTAPAVPWSNPMGLTVSVGNHSNWVGQFNPVGVWTDSASGIGLWATTNNGYAIMANTDGGGWAGLFNGNVQINGNLSMSNFRATQLINQFGPLPITSNTFSTSGGTLLLFYSGSGYSAVINRLVGMGIYLDGNLIDQTGIFANSSGMHLGFVNKEWVLTGVSAGTHTVTLQALSGTSTNSDDIFHVSVLELPF